MQNKPIVTYLLIVANTIVFLLEWLDAGSTLDTLNKLSWGANFAPYTLNNEWWRLFTSAFLHFGLLHLVMNMFGLFIVGREVERAIGSISFICVYLLCALGGGILSIYWNLFNIIVGASGAIFGLFGFEIFLVIALVRGDRAQILRIALSFGVYLVIIFTAGQFLPFDNAGHLGGLLIGILLGMAYGFVLTSQRQWIMTLTAFLFGLLVIFSLIPRYQKHYFDAFQELLLLDDSFRKSLTENDKDSLILQDMRLLYLEADTVNAKFDSLVADVPDALIEDLAIIKTIIKGKSEESRFIITLLERESYIYYDSIEYARANLLPWDKIKYQLRMEAPQEEPDTAQGQDGLEVVKQYYDQDWIPCDIYQAKFFRLGFKDSLDRWNGPVRDYYLDGGIQMKGDYKKDLKDGVFIYYSRDSTYESAGRYSGDFRVGKWENFNDQGKLMREIRYGQGGYLINQWNDLGEKVVDKGNGEVIDYHSNDVIASYEFYKNGKKDSISYGFHADGSEYFKEFWDGGRLINGIAYDLSGNTYRYDESVQGTYPVGGLEEFWAYIDTSKAAYELADTPYEVELTFAITEEGEVYNIRVMKGENHELNQVAMDLLEQGPKWIPAKKHGIEPLASEGWVKINL